MTALTVVAKVESTLEIPTFPKIATSPAKKAENKAYKIQGCMQISIIAFL